MQRVVTRKAKGYVEIACGKNKRRHLKSKKEDPQTTNSNSQQRQQAQLFIPSSATRLVSRLKCNQINNRIMFSSLARKSVSSSSASAVVRNTVVRSTAVRSFASSEAADDKLKHAPPVSVYGTVARYANATYSAASKQGLLDQVESELNGLAKAAKDSQAFSQFLENPLISRNEKSSLIESILQEKNISVITTNLCTTLAGNARLNELTKVVSTYSTLMKAKRGEVDATIISADPLTKKETEQVAAAIKATSKATGEVIISSKVDPSIIGGIQVQIGDQFLDLSIKSRIEEISRMSI